MDKKLAELFENPLFSVFGGGIQFSILRRGPKQRNLELDSLKGLLLLLLFPQILLWRKNKKLNPS